MYPLESFESCILRLKTSSKKLLDAVNRKSSRRSSYFTPSTAVIASSVLICLPLLMFPSTVTGRREEKSPPVGRTKASLVHHRLTRQFLPRGLTGNIRCPVEAEPPRRMIVWIKEDKGVLSVERNREEAVEDDMIDDYDDDGDEYHLHGDVEDDVELEDRITIDMAGMLTISDVTWSDAGTYRCTLYSPVDGNDETHTINVYVRDPAVFTTRPSTIYQRLIGQSVTMPCVAEGDPRPNIHWIKIDGEFPSTTRTLQEEGNLTIVHLNTDDHGIYECIATNIVARTITSALLIIHASSFNVPYNVTVERTTDTTAILSWLPAYSAEHHHHHVLWFKKQGGKHARWHTISINSDDITSVVVHDLHPDTTYRFMVMSRDDQNEAYYSDVVLARTLGTAAVAGGSQPDEVEQTPNSQSVHWTTPTTPPSRVTATSTLVAALHRTLGGREFETSYTSSCLSDAGTTRPLAVNDPARPRPPYDVRATQSLDGDDPGTIVISWTAPASALGENDSQTTSPVDHFAIEYRTDADWVPLVDRVDVITVDQTDTERNQTITMSFTWVEPTRGVVHEFRVISVSKDAVQSDPSEVATLHVADPLVNGSTRVRESTSTITRISGSTDILVKGSTRVSSDFIAGVIGGLLFFMLFVTLIAVAFKFCYSRRRSLKRRDVAAAPRTVNNHFGHRLPAVDNNTRIAIETPI